MEKVQTIPGEEDSAEERSIAKRVRTAAPGVICVINSIDIHMHDMTSLAPRGWLNDNIINAVIYMVTQISKKPSLYAFQTFFMTVLRSRSYDDVASWTKNVILFLSLFLVAKTSLIYIYIYIHIYI